MRANQVSLGEVGAIENRAVQPPPRRSNMWSFHSSFLGSSILALCKYLFVGRTSVFESQPSRRRVVRSNSPEKSHACTDAGSIDGTNYNGRCRHFLGKLATVQEKSMANMLETMPSVGTAAPGQVVRHSHQMRKKSARRRAEASRDTATVIGEFSNGNRYPL